MRFTLKQLQVFAETARFGNISRAADNLALSQSAASNALKELEQHYDVQLFDRIGKRLKLNATGTALRPLVEQLLEQAQALEAQLRQEGIFSELKIGATLTIGNYLIADIMIDYFKAHPNARLDLHVANTAAITGGILNFQLDMGLVEGEINHPDLHINVWREDKLTLFAAPDHPLAQKPRLTEAELLHAKWILREKGSGTRQIFERDLGALVNRLDILLELSQTQAIKQAVKSGLGIGCLSEIVLQESFQTGSLVPLRFEAGLFSRKLYIVRHKQKHLGLALSSWLDMLNSYATVKV